MKTKIKHKEIARRLLEIARRMSEWEKALRENGVSIEPPDADMIPLALDILGEPKDDLNCETGEGWCRDHAWFAFGEMVRDSGDIDRFIDYIISGGTTDDKTDEKTP